MPVLGKTNKPDSMNTTSNGCRRGKNVMRGRKRCVKREETSQILLDLSPPKTDSYVRTSEKKKTKKGSVVAGNSQFRFFTDLKTGKNT